MTMMRQTNVRDLISMPIAIETRQLRISRAELASPAGTLKVKTQLCILQNRKFFSDLATHSPHCNPFSRISNAMKKEIIELSNKMQKDRVATEDSFELQCHILGLLMNHKVTEFHFPLELMREGNEAAAAALCQQLVELRPPDLHTLASFSPNTNYFWDVCPLTTSMLDHFPHLQVLQIEGCLFGDRELLRISDQLPNLRVLEVFLNIRHTSRIGISALSKLECLEEFCFLKGPNMRSQPVTLLLKLCFELLPRLHVVALNPKLHMRHKKMLGTATSSALTSLGARTLHLRRLALSGRVRIPEHVALPHLQFLCLNWPTEPANVDVGRFPQLSQLALHGVCQVELARILGRVGHQLDALHFEVTDIVQLDRVLDTCPNLSELGMHVFGVSSAVPQLRPDTLRRLQKLRVTFADSDYVHEPGLLLELLRHAPELRLLYVSLQTVYVRLLEDLFLLAKQHTCMQKLEELKVYVDSDHCEGYLRALLGMTVLFCTFECEQLKKVVMAVKNT